MATARTPPPVDLSMLLNQAGYALSNRLAAALAELDMSVRVYCVLAKAAEGEHTQGRQWGFLGEQTVNVLELNLALDRGQ